MAYKLLIINPGSTSTKIGVYEDEKELFEETLRHTNEELKQFDTIFDQFQFRKDLILEFIDKKNFDIKSLDAVVGRGGLLKPIEGGTYSVNDAMIEDLKVGVQGPHASNLGGILARSIADELGIPSYIVDPVVTDELADVARLSGVPELPRKSIFHALNQKAVAKRYGKESGKGYENLNLVVVHMGGGVSVAAHSNGRVIDVNNTLDGDGPFSPERAGAVPAGELIKMCFSGDYSEKEVYQKIVGKGGFVGYLNTNDVKETIDKMEAGDKECEKIYKAFLYQITKSVGEMSAVLKGKVDQIILTGGIAYSPTLVPDLKANVEWIAPVTVYPGEDELLALAQGAIRVLSGEEKAKIY
ncbi:MAG: butyrate kinase [Clostridium butyricum]|nr:butyrate kinase [Clostridium butyricum]